MSRTLRPSVRLASLALVTAMSTFAAACSAGGPTSPSGPSSGGSNSAPSNSAPTLTGVYQFAAVNGCSVPCVFDSYDMGLGVTMAMEAVRGRLMLNADGTYLQEMEMRLHNSIAADVVLIRAGAGSYTVVGATLTMTPFEGKPFQPFYRPGEIQIQTEAPGLDGNSEVFIFTFRQ